VRGSRIRVRRALTSWMAVATFLRRVGTVTTQKIHCFVFCLGFGRSLGFGCFVSMISPNDPTILIDASRVISNEKRPKKAVSPMAGCVCVCHNRWEQWEIR